MSPAYDITFACDAGNKWLQAHQMMINGKKSDILLDDLLACGQTMDMKPAKCKKIIAEVEAAVRDWPSIAHSAGIREKTIHLVQVEIERKRGE